jgi:hypothetical protein
MTAVRAYGIYESVYHAYARYSIMTNTESGRISQHAGFRGADWEYYLCREAEDVDFKYAEDQ